MNDHRHDSSHPRRGLALCVLLVLLVPGLASAQVGTLSRFDPGETTEDDFAMSRRGDFGHLRFGAQLHLDYGLNPLVYEQMLGDASSEVLSVVEHQLDATLGLSFGLFDRFVVFAGLPVTLLMDGAPEPDVTPLRVAPADGAGLGDIYLGARARLFGEDEDVFALGVQATVTFPTSSGSTYRGDTFLTVHPELMAEVRSGAGARFVLNAGALIREETSGAINLQFRHELTYGVGFAMPVWEDDADGTTHLDAHVSSTARARSRFSASGRAPRSRQPRG